MGTAARRTARIGVIFATVLACTAFAATAGAADCNPLSTNTCITPFPANYWAQPDASSPTGMRAQVSDDLIRPQLLNALPTADGITPTGVFGGATGFSAGVGAVFEFSKAPSAASLPADGGNAVIAWDLDANKRVPVHVMVSDDAMNPLLVSRQSHVIQVFPQVRWDFGHRILIAVTKQLNVPGSSDPDFDTLAAAPAAGTLRGVSYINEVRAGLTQAGISSANVRSATVFTVRPRSESAGRTQALIDNTAARSHAVRKLSVSYDLLNASVGALVTGELRVDNMRKKNGTGDVDFTGATRRGQWIPFRLTLPRSAATKAARVVIYAHGLGGAKEMDIEATTSNASHGYATLSVDWPNHGARADADGGYILFALTPAKLAQHAGMLNQAAIDLAGVHKALTTSLAKVDYLKRGSLFNPLGWGSDGKADIDPSHVVIEGTSLGGVLGSGYAALSQRLDGIAFAVSGVGISHILSESILWPLGFGFVMPHQATGAEHAVLLAALQHVVDPADAINSFDFVSSPRPGQQKKPFLLMLGQGDSVVPNPSSVAMANLSGTPLVGKQLFPMPGLTTQNSPSTDGSAVRQFPPLTWPFQLPVISAASSHGISLSPSTTSAREQFLDRVTATH